MNTDKPSVLLFRRCGEVVFYLQSFTYDNEGFDFTFCMDPSEAIVFDSALYKLFKTFFKAASDDLFYFVRIYLDEL